MLHTKQHWLDALEKFPSHFSKYPELMEMLSHCDPNPVNVMSCIVKEVLGPCDVVGRLDCGLTCDGSSSVLDVIEGSTSFQHTSLSLQIELEDTKRKACILYGFVIEQILMKETSRLGTSNHGQLVIKESFHRALLAICLDLVIEAKCVIEFRFPWAANCARTCQFDILRVIESFLIIMDRELPVELKAHVRSVNIMILECHAWKNTTTKSTDLLDIIETHVMEGGQWGEDMTVTCADLVLDIGTNMSIEKAVERTKKLEEARLHSAGASDLSASLSLIFFHLSSLCAERVSKLCRVHLEMNEDFVSQVWTVAYQALVSKPMILRNRHLDTIIMCSVYSICKVRKDISNRMKFDTILKAYRIMSQMQSTHLGNKLIDVHFVTNDIELDQPGKRGGIIDFYNLLFIPVMKHYILNFQGLEKQMAEISTIKTISDVHHVWNIASGDDAMEGKGLTATTIAKSRNPRHPLLTSSNNNLHLQPLGPTNGYRTAYIVQQLPFQWHHNDENVNDHPCSRFTQPGVYVTITASNSEEVEDINHSLSGTTTTNTLEGRI